MPASEIPDWVTYPEDEWVRITPAEAGMDLVRWEKFLAESQIEAGEWGGETHGEGEWGAVLTRGGYLVHEWGNGEYRFQTASVGKALTRALAGLAFADGLIQPDDLISETWTGEGELSHPHKYLNEEHHRKLAWRHLLGPKDRYGHHGGFPVTNGFFWAKGSTAQSKAEADKSIPDWANCTGDPFYDNYAHAEPGTVEIYSSGGRWRLSQALTVLWNRDLKDVLDEKLFSKIGIPADRWEWIPGREVFENKSFYPHMPGYGDFIDPPYEFNRHPVRGGGGWAIMSATDLARFGHLVACRGWWKGELLLDEEWLRSHHGGNHSQLGGESTHFTAMGRVCTQGINHPLPEELFAGPVRGA